MLSMTVPSKPTPCADEPDLFFDPTRVAEAKAICAGCWFASHCAEIGAEENDGLWGGVTSHNLAREQSAAMAEKVVELFDAGQGPQPIANELGMSRTQVSRILKRERPEGNLTRLKTAADERAERDANIIALFHEGLALREIAERLNVSPGLVGRITTGAGLYRVSVTAA